MLQNPPTGFESTYIQIGGVRVRLVQGGQGDPVFMVHGLGGSADDFYGPAGFLASKFRLFLIDLPGFGLSEKPDAPYSAPWFEQILAELALKLGHATPAWVGHSMGGMLVLRLAALRPELVSKAAVVCPAGGHPAATHVYRLLSFLVADKNDRLRFYHPRLIELSFNCIFNDPGSPEARGLLKRVKRQWAEQRRELEVPLVRSGRGIIRDPVWPLVGRITCPRLVITGGRDKVTPKADTDRLLANMAAGCNHIAMNCGHMPVYSKSGELAAHLAGFLEAEPLT